MGLLIFLPAGTLAYGYGWLFMALLFMPVFGAGLGCWKGKYIPLHPNVLCRDTCPRVYAGGSLPLPYKRNEGGTLAKVPALLSRAKS